MATQVKEKSNNDALSSRETFAPAMVRVLIYYAAVALLFVLVWWLGSMVPAPERADANNLLTGQGALESASEWLGNVRAAAPNWLEAAIQMIASVLLVLPLAGVYLRTRDRVKFDHSLIQTVIVLPMAVTAILMMVRNSLALAFSLAGVVAAVRFRNNLKESRDAVYIFTAIAVGFAAGVQALGVALILSFLFSVLELILWRLDVVESYDAHFRRLCTGDVTEVPRAPIRFSVELAPDEATGDKADADKRPMVRLRLRMRNLMLGQAPVEVVLGAETKKWTFIGRELATGGAGVLEYEVRLRKRTPAEALVQLLRQGPSSQVASVEWPDGIAALDAPATPRTPQPAQAMPGTTGSTGTPGPSSGGPTGAAPSGAPQPPRP